MLQTLPQRRNSRPIFRVQNQIFLRHHGHFNDFINQEFSGQTFIAHCEETDKKSLKSQLKTASDYTILIGPEGDFSVKEIEIALHHNFIPVTLGNTRLRTETAAIVACHSVAYTNE